MLCRQSAFAFALLSFLLVSTAHAWIETDDHCSTCMTTLTALEEAGLSNSTMKELQLALDALCMTLPQHYRQGCRQAVTSVLGSLESLDMKLVDTYTPQQFCSVLGFCQTYCCGDPYEPQEIHISLTQQPSQMVIMWVSQNLADQPTVRYGASPSNLTMEATGTYHTYNWGGWNGWNYVVTLDNLSPRTKYYYQAGDPRHYMSQTIYQFTTAPTTIQPTDTFSFITYGDMGYDNSADPTLHWLGDAAYQHEVDVILHVGDISYADGYQPSWDVALQKLEPVAAQVPYMTCTGNHEEFFDFAAYRNRFTMPTSIDNLSGVNRVNMTLYYSFDYGHAHFVALNSEAFWGMAPDLRPGEAQHEWLVSDLASVDRSKTPWVVVYLHRPMYCSSSHKRCVDQAAHYRKMIEQVLYENRVDLVLTGHVHNYERTLPVYNSTVVGDVTAATKTFNNPQAPIYSVIGTAGNIEGTSGSGGNEGPWSVPSSQYSVWGYSAFKMTSDFLSWTFYQASDHTPLDSFSISKQ